MKKIIIRIALCLVVLLNMPIVSAAGSLSVSSSSLTITVGSSKSITVRASSAAGRVDISSSNSGVAKINKSNAFLDNSSTSITVKGVKVGTAVVYIKLSDVATYDGKVLSGTRQVKINVVEKKATTKTPAKPKVEEPLKVNSIKIVGYPISFSESVKDYAIDIANTLEELYLSASTNGTAKGIGLVNIKDKNEITVRFTKGKDTKEYKIKLNRLEEVKEKIVEKIVEKKVKEEAKPTFNIFIITTIIFFILSVILGIILLVVVLSKNKKNKK